MNGEEFVNASEIYAVKRLRASLRQAGFGTTNVKEEIDSDEKQTELRRISLGPQELFLDRILRSQDSVGLTIQNG